MVHKVLAGTPVLLEIRQKQGVAQPDIQLGFEGLKS